MSELCGLRRARTHAHISVRYDNVVVIGTQLMRTGGEITQLAVLSDVTTIVTSSISAVVHA